MMLYTAVISDLGGVAVEFNADQVVHRMAQVIGRPFDEVQAAVYHKELLVPFELGRITPIAYYEGLKKRLPLRWTYEQFVGFWNNIFQENREVTEILQRLHKRHKIIALTNTNELHLAYLKSTIPSLSVFDDWVASCEVGMRKPDLEIYRLALKRANVQPDTVVYVDDRPELVDAGKQLGCSAIRFENSRQLEQDLVALGLNF
jgi:putative hydrolase of the HAD superfamily